MALNAEVHGHRSAPHGTGGQPDCSSRHTRRCHVSTPAHVGVFWRYWNRCAFPDDANGPERSKASARELCTCLSRQAPGRSRHVFGRRGSGGQGRPPDVGTRRTPVVSAPCCTAQDLPQRQGISPRMRLAPMSDVRMPVNQEPSTARTRDMLPHTRCAFSPAAVSIAVAPQQRAASWSCNPAFCTPAHYTLPCWCTYVLSLMC